MSTSKAHPLIKACSSLLGLVVVLAILVAVNVIVSNMNLRTDLTDEQLYSLSDGSRNMLAKLPNKVTLKYFFSRSNRAVSTGLKSYAQRVEDLLEEYARASRGQLTLEKIDPTPDSDEEDWARKYGLAGQAFELYGAPVYFGLVAISGKKEVAIPAFSPEMQTLMEYHVSRLITEAANPQKQLIGLLSSMPVLGAQGSPMMMPGQPPPQNIPAWVAFDELRRSFDVREITPDQAATGIPADLRALLVVHPKQLGEQVEYALDQFVLGGGHLIVCLDPLSFADQSSQPPQQFQQATFSSDLPTLLKAWGIGYDPTKLLADKDAGTTMQTAADRIEQNPVVLSYGPDHINQDDIATSQLQSITTAFAGYFEDNTGDALTVTPLLTSSGNAGQVAVMTARLGGDAIKKSIQPFGAPRALGLSLTGTFTTAFPAGAPAAGDTPAAPTAAPAPTLKSGESTVVLLADVDLFFDAVCVEPVRVFGGGNAYRPRNDNLALLANLVDQMSGSEDMISIRTRARYDRSFTEVEKLEKAAQARLQEQVAILQQQLQETQTRVNAMARQSDGSMQLGISAQQQQEIEIFRAKELEISKQLRQVQKDLRRDVDRLGTRLKLINFGLMPLLVCCFGLGMAIIRKRRI